MVGRKAQIIKKGKRKQKNERFNNRGVVKGWRNPS